MPMAQKATYTYLGKTGLRVSVPVVSRFLATLRLPVDTVLTQPSYTRLVQCRMAALLGWYVIVLYASERPDPLVIAVGFA